MGATAEAYDPLYLQGHRLLQRVRVFRSARGVGRTVEELQRRVAAVL